MKTTTRTHAARLAAFVALSVGSAPAWGQQGAPKPEIMVMVGTSRSMEYAPGYQANGADNVVDCPLGPGPAANRIYTRSRIQVVKDVLTGKAPGDYYCRKVEPCAAGGACLSLPRMGEDMDPALVHSRAFCCATPVAQGGMCSTWVPCAGDSGEVQEVANNRVEPAADASIPVYNPLAGTIVDGSGVIYKTRTEVKWGLMTFDSDPSAHENLNGQFSYPSADEEPADADGRVPEPDVRQPANYNALVAGTPVGQAWRGIAHFSPAEEMWPLNLGIRNSKAPFGPLVGGNMGSMIDPREVDPIDFRVESHNIFVANKVRDIVPSGASPIAPALYDAFQYYGREAEPPPVGDPYNACRSRSLVLITDRAPTNYIGGMNCPIGNDAVCGALVGGSRCVGAAQAGQLPPGTGVCQLPDGYPYETSVKYAGDLRLKNVPVFVVGFSAPPAADAALQAIADAGSMGLGPSGGGGFFHADDADELRDALMKVRNSLLAGTRSHTRPVILRPGKGDTEAPVANNANINNPRAVRQWRLDAWSEISGSSDPFWYGRILRTDYGCSDADSTLARDTVGSARFDAVLAQMDNARETRRVVTRSSDRLSNHAVLGISGQTIFQRSGLLGTLLTEPAVRALAALPPGPESLRALGMRLNAFFGTRGLPDGAMGAPSDGAMGAPSGEEQLGSIVESDLVAITAPNLPLTSGPYNAFATTHANRPAVLAAGGNDGMVHFFRVDNGFELLNFVPRKAWEWLKETEEHRIVDGPMEATDIAHCRKFGAAAPANCPDQLTADSFRTMLVGGVGTNASNVFGIDVTHLTTLGLATQDDRTTQPALATLFPNTSVERPFLWDFTMDDEPKLGLSVSRPALVHVRDRDSVRGAVIVGCGDDHSRPLNANINGVGRCVLVLDAVTGALITRIDNADVDPAKPDRLDMPMVGAPAVWPRGGVAPADRAFIGDKLGRLWRLDLRAKNPAEWKIRMIWPTGGAADNGFTTGREVVGRPATFIEPSGKLGVVFTTGDSVQVTGAEAAPLGGHAVSLSDGTVLDVAANQVRFETTVNWVYPLAADEIGTGEVVVVDEMALFTTARADLQVCTQATGRLYGVHAFETNLDAAGTKRVKPMIPRRDVDGNYLQPALALVLPQGRIAYGLTLAQVPACTPGEASATEVVLNLNDDEAGSRGSVSAEKMGIETMNNAGTIQKVAYDKSVFASNKGSQLSICLNCNQKGAPKGGTGGKLAPLPSTVSYWGSTFTD